MTENEAQKHLELCKKSRIFIPKNDVLETAIQAIEEIQQIKEIISNFPLDCGSPVEDIKEIYRQLRGFLQIGTIEEFKALKEKNEPKKPNKDEFNRFTCPDCGWIVSTEEYGGRFLPHCENCGQSIDCRE